MDEPEISVIVATCNHAAVLPLCLQHLENQEFPTAGYEVVVADGGSSDGTLELAQRYAAGSPVRVTALNSAKGQGLVPALNAGAAAARGRLLLLLAPGLLAGPTLLARHLEAHAQQGEDHAAIGGVQAHPQVPLPPFTHWFLRFSTSQGNPDTPDFLDWHALNLSLPREAFARVGGFDEGFAYPVFHACELGWRMARAGMEARSLPDARTYRWQEISLDEALVLRYAQGYCLHRLILQTQDIVIRHRFVLERKRLRALADSALMPFYLRLCRDSAGETRVLGAILRRTLHHHFQQGYADARAGRGPAPTMMAATFPPL